MGFVAVVSFFAFANPAAPAADEKPAIAQGIMHTVDLKEGKFVLGGTNEGQATFRFGVKKGEREAEVLLDGKPATLATAFKPGRKATVTYVTVGDAHWASKVEMTSGGK